MDLRVALIQTHLKWNNPEDNRSHLAELMDAVNADIVVLPEMFTTAFNVSPSDQTEVFSPTGPTPNWMREQAKKLDALVVGSVAIQENGSFYNRLIAMSPNGTMENYDKRHLFSFGGEDEAYSAGNSRLIVQHKGWKICPLICYDLRFPVWSRNSLLQDEYDYDVLLYVANWPSPRAHAWSDLLRARAHENQAFVIGVNRVGSDENGLSYSGGSMVIDPKGHEVIPPLGDQEEVNTTTLQREELEEFRLKFPVLKDADEFVVNPDAPEETAPKKRGFWR